MAGSRTSRWRKRSVIGWRKDDRPPNVSDPRGDPPPGGVFSIASRTAARRTCTLWVFCPESTSERRAGTLMAGRGFPAEPGSRRYKKIRTHEVIATSGQLHGPPLPTYIPGLGDGKVRWHPQTRRWWTAWRRSPQAVRMITELDWTFLFETALLHHRFWADGEVKLGAELRIRQAKFGATPEDRSRLRVEVQDAGATVRINVAERDDGGRAEVSQMDDARRRRLVGESPAVSD